MSRNGSGVYTFPSSEFKPAVSGGTLTAASWNTLVSDIETAMTASIASDGQTTCSARIPFAAGASATGSAVSAVAYSRTGDTNTGLYFPAADQLGLSAGGVAIMTATSSGVTMPLATTFSAGVTFSGAISTIDINGGTIDGATIGGNSAAAGTFTQVTVDNLLVNGNTISTTDTNGNLILSPDGTGEIQAAGHVDLQAAYTLRMDVNAIGSIGGGTQDIDLTSGRIVSGTVDTSTTTFTFSNPLATGHFDGFILYLTNGGSQTVNWPGSVDWGDSGAPTLTTSGTDMLIFSTKDGGTNWQGFTATQGI